MNFISIYYIIIVGIFACKNMHDMNSESIPAGIDQPNIPYDTAFANYLSLFSKQFDMNSKEVREQKFKLSDYQKYLCKEGNCCGIQSDVDNIYFLYRFSNNEDSIESVLVSGFKEKFDSIEDDWDFSSLYFYIYNKSGNILNCKILGTSSQKHECEYFLVNDSILVNQLTFVDVPDVEKIQNVIEEKYRFYRVNKNLVQETLYRNKRGKIQYFEDSSGHLTYKHIE